MYNCNLGRENLFHSRRGRLSVTGNKSFAFLYLCNKICF